MQIQFFKRSEIDEEKWNRLIEEHGNGFPYAFSWYLDITAQKNWSALVLGDYDVVLPFCWGRKFGIPQIYKPPFTQQLGIIANRKISQEEFERFIKALPTKYWRVQIPFNFKNQFEHSKFQKKANYCLSLSSSFPIIQKKFSQNLKRNIKRAKEFGVNIGKPLSIEEHLQYFKKEMIDKKAKLPDHHLEILHKLLKTCLTIKKGLIKTAYSKDGEVLASTFLLDSPTRIINLIVWSNLKGKQQFATHYLLSEIIRTNANQAKIFDFEGSNIPTIADFNRRFGAENVPYSIYEQLKFPLNLINHY